MSHVRLLSLRSALCLLMAVLACASHVQAETIGSGLMNARPAQQQPVRRRAPRAPIAEEQAAEAYSPPAARQTNSFVSHVIGQMHTVQYDNRELAPVPMEGEAMIQSSEYLGEGYQGPMDNSCAGAEFSGCDGCGIWGLLVRAFHRSEIYHGVSAFSGPINRGGTGSFGAEAGVNMGAALWGGWQGLGFQAGAGGTLSNFNGADFTRDDRGQVFVTLGLFRRVDWGLQGGLVVDHLHDDWYANVDLNQVRGEISWVMPEGYDIGCYFATSDDSKLVTGTLQTGTALPTTVTERWHVNDISTLFVRHTFANNAQARIFAGWSGASDGVIGADMYMPLDNNWSIRNSFTYLLPQEGPLDGGNARESWNVSIQLVWYPGCTTNCGKDYYRPLMNVANNGSFFVSR